MKACSAYAEELANCAATGQTPHSRLGSHLESCVACRAALDELQGMAMLNTRVAVQLRDPSRSISLESAFLRSVAKPRRHSARRMFVLSAAAAGAVVLLALWGLQMKPTPVATVAVDVPKTEIAWEPTWQRLREEVRTDTLGANQGGGTIIAHYRVKDAYSDLN